MKFWSLLLICLCVSPPAFCGDALQEEAAAGRILQKRLSVIFAHPLNTENFRRRELPKLQRDLQKAIRVSGQLRSHPHPIYKFIAEVSAENLGVDLTPSLFAPCVYDPKPYSRVLRWPNTGTVMTCYQQKVSKNEKWTLSYRPDSQYLTLFLEYKGATRTLFFHFRKDGLYVFQPSDPLGFYLPLNGRQLSFLKKYPMHLGRIGYLSVQHMVGEYWMPPGSKVVSPPQNLMARQGVGHVVCRHGRCAFKMAKGRKRPLFRNVGFREGALEAAPSRAFDHRRLAVLKKTCALSTSPKYIASIQNFIRTSYNSFGFLITERTPDLARLRQQCDRMIRYLEAHHAP